MKRKHIPKYPNTPTPAERLRQLARAAAAVTLTAAVLVYFATLIIVF